MTWASTLDRIVIWGGWGATFINDIYSFDSVSHDWQQIEPNVFCSGNTGFAIPNGSDENGLAYDPINNMLWIVNGGSGYRCWSEASASFIAAAGSGTNKLVATTLTASTQDYYLDYQVYNPAAGSYAVVTAYDAASKTLTLDTNLNLAPGAAFKLFADAGNGTWSYDFATKSYSKLEKRHWGYTGAVPSGRRLSPGFAGNGSSYAILFGGVGQYDYNRWTYDNSTWKLDFATKTYTQVLPMGLNSSPVARTQIENQFVYDSVHNVFVLFGGRCVDSSRCPNSSGLYDDTWIYDPTANTWTQINTTTQPTARNQAQMYFDSRNGVVVLFGGLDPTGIVNDLWTFNTGTLSWTKVTAFNSAPTPLYQSAAAFSPITGCGYIVDGATTGAVSQNVSYELCLTNSNASPPTAIITASATSGTVATEFSFSGTGSSDPDGSIVSYAWNFGDGTAGSGASVSKTYTAAGTYTVTLTVTDNSGLTTTKSQTVTVSSAAPTNQPPVANIVLSPASAVVGTTFTLDGSASSDTDGSILSYAWNFGDGTSGTGASVNKTYAAAGVYTVALTVTDNQSATGSATATITVTQAGGTSINVAAQANGGVASASSSYNAGYAPTGANNGDRKGLNWANGGGWNDATGGTYPDWLQITFNGAQTIGEIDVFTVQDNYNGPLDPTLAMTFSQYGITAFQVQYWNGAAWADISGGNVTGNNRIWRQFTFAPVTTDRIRVLVNSALNTYSRITEVEAWTTSGAGNVSPTVALTSPANNASFTAPANIGLAATAADTDGSISKVEFYRGATLVATVNSAPYAYLDSGLAAGSYTYTARAYDNSGASTTSSATTISVTASNVAPTVSLTSPANNASFTAPASINLAASAADSDGSIAKVEFYRGATLVATVNSAPYAYLDSGLAAGSYTYTARAYDNSGASTTSSATTISVSASNVAPTVSLTSPANNASFTAPASVNLAATAADSDGSIAKVEFYRGATLVATVTSAPYAYSDSGLAAGAYTYTARAYDNSDASTTSSVANVTVSAATGTRINIAAQANGGVASASSSYNAGYAPSGANNGDRKGLNWAHGGGWNDATGGTYPDWLQITFNGAQTLGEIDVFTVQDNYNAPVAPTLEMTFSQYGITAFQVQYWNGSAWLDVPGGNVTGNNRIWRQFTFAPITTDRIRVLINSALNTYSRITEVEAWTQ